VAHRPATGEASGQRVEFFKARRDCDARGAFAGRSFPMIHFSAEGALPGRTEAVTCERVPNIAELGQIIRKATQQKTNLASSNFRPA
jgi:hypothetical protein